MLTKAWAGSVEDKFEERFEKHIRFLENQLEFIERTAEIIEKCPTFAGKVRSIKRLLKFSD